MTVAAVIAAFYMSRVLASRNDTIMAGATTTQNLCMIDGHHGRPQIRGMAVFADIAGLNVCRAFAGRVRAVMAAHTIAGDVQVIEIRR